jgi:hypothetical protein
MDGGGSGRRPGTPGRGYGERRRGMAITPNKQIGIQERSGGKILEIVVAGKLERKDYESFVPEFERRIREHGKIRVLFCMKDFHGWTPGALWEDLKLDLKHFRDIERLALVGEERWQKGMAIFCKPFTTAEVRYFDLTEFDDARRWIEE